MEMAVVFREGHCSLHGKIMRTIFHSIKLLHLAQLATHTKVKERDPFLYDREEWRMCMRGQARKAHTEREASTIYHHLKWYSCEYQCIDVRLYCTFPLKDQNHRWKGLVSYRLSSNESDLAGSALLRLYSDSKFKSGVGKRHVSLVKHVYAHTHKRAGTSRRNTSTRQKHILHHP